MYRLNYKIITLILCGWFLSLPGPIRAEEVLTWDDCVREALENHPDLIAAGEKVVQAKEDKDISKADILPQISGQLSGKRSKTPFTRRNWPVCRWSWLSFRNGSSWRG